VNVLRKIIFFLLVSAILVLSCCVVSGATLGELNALGQAEMYLNMTGFSYSGLVKQLEFEGYSREEAVYGVENCGADWNEQAAIKAKEYLAIQKFSKKGLIEQLRFEGFTKEQAAYGVKQAGY